MDRFINLMTASPTRAKRYVRVLKKKISHAYVAYAKSKQPYHVRKRVDSEDRWQTISDHIDSNDTSAIDIGCASGYFTAQLARSGIFSVGIDIERSRLNDAYRLYSERPGLAFMEYRVAPDTVHMLPGFDITLLLTVYHHWTANFGRENAEHMLKVLASRTKKLFFEVPGSGSIDIAKYFERWPVATRPKLENESIQEYYTWILNGILQSDVDIVYLGEYEYMKSSSRRDSMFLIQCGDYHV
jgi:SAM-dependent methyltransferase